MSTKHQSDHKQEAASDEHASVDALRLWLTSGIHMFAVDPRRRLGRHARVRQLLTQDCPTPPGSAGAWQSLASTLDRHTVLGGMTELSSQERRVLTLAYLEGCTNREIAVGLGLSVGTVRLLLRKALKGIDTYLTRTGTWIYAILLLGAGHVIGAASRFGRATRFVGSAEWTQVLGSAAAVGAITAAAIGSAAISPSSIGPENPTPPVTVQTIAALPSVGTKVAPLQRPGLAPAPKPTTVPAASRSNGQGQADNAIDNQTTGADHANNGNGGQGLALGHLKQASGHSSDQGSPPGQAEQKP
jgi:hypothetical protein